MPPGRIILIAWIIYALAFTLALARRAPASRKNGKRPRGLGDQLRILVIGATGGTGRELVRQALAQGHQVTAFVRNPESSR
jgi:FlaA1/EpsC-like NDP-sugar epimerase